MRLFQCQCCRQVLHFENTVCLRCDAPVGYLPQEDRMAAVEPDGARWRVRSGGEVASVAGSGIGHWRFCRNWELSACNWMVPADEGAGHFDYCLACQHNRTVPNLDEPANNARWQKIEAAKRRLFYSLFRLGLPLPVPGFGHPQPLVFDFLAAEPASGQSVLTGHAYGVVTIALTEADDVAREQVRVEMGEAYRTLLGHFRHEIGHYYWDLLVRDGGALEAFRAVFGDERADYAMALERHYRDGAPLGWQDSHVSAYATMHPWEDWAETWAHYLHMMDALDTAAALGLRVRPEADAGGGLAAEVAFDPYREVDAKRLFSAWLPLTVALNMLSRSMSAADLYPFALSAGVQRKMAFVHELVAGPRS